MSRPGAQRVVTSSSSLTAGTARVSGPRRLQSVTAQGLGVRQELRAMPPEDQERFMDAVIKMMENTPGVPQSSEYFRIAGYHGWPGGFCHHGVETFPAWHRAYLLEFERALQAADRALGRDGALSLPYWDWTNLNYPDVIPAVLRRRLPDLLPGLVAGQNQLTQNGYRRLARDDRLRQLIRSNNLLGSNSVVWRALLEPVHWRYASTENTRTPSIETPHNTIHVLCGFPMTVVDYAAFHPLFFLHHCNIDRLWAAYLAANPDSQEEMARHQLRLTSQRAGRTLLTQDPARPRTLYEQPLEPFRRLDGSVYTSADMFSTAALGYTYDDLPAIPPQQIREPPTLAVFENIDVVGALAHRSYLLHVYLLTPEAAAGWVPPSEPDTVHEVEGYAGSGGVFGGKGTECDNCREARKPVTVEVDVSERLRLLGLSRFQVAVRVAVEDEEGTMHNLEDTPVPAPQLQGPYWEDRMAVPLQQGTTPADVDTGLHQALVLQLQKALQRFGYYKDVLDGDFGPVTDAAVKRLQTFLKLDVDGVAGPLTKAAVLRPRYDLHEDADDVPEDTAAFAVAETVTWFLDLPPGYLDVSKVRSEVVTALSEWAEVVPVFFTEVDSAEGALLRVQWSDITADNLFKADGPGGSLAQTQHGVITLDDSERWLLQGQPRGPGTFYLLPVLLHEVGHALGLTHSDLEEDVMAPFYRDDKIKLSSTDQERIVALYPLEAQYAQVFHVLDQDKDGLLSRDELIHALTQRGSQPLTMEDAETLWLEAAGRPETSAGGSAVRTSSGAPGIDLKRFLQLITRYFYGDGD